MTEEKVPLDETLLWLCSVASPPGKEGALSEALVNGVAPLFPALRRYGHTFVVPVRRESGGPHVVFAAQLDVLEAGQPATPRIDGRRLFGAGAVDAKPGLALMLDLAARPPSARVDVTLVFHARGECGFDVGELRPVLERDPELRHADLAVVLKPTNNAVQLGCGGSTHATLAFAGRSTHSALGDPTYNPFFKFAPVLERLVAREPTTDVVDGLTWFERITPTSAQGGRFGSVAPDELQVNVHHTFGPSMDSHDSQDRLIALVDRVGAVRFEELSPAAPPASREHPLVASLIRAAGGEVQARQAWSEVACFHAFGVTAVNFGPGDAALSHARGESLDLDELEAARTVLERWLGAFA